MNSAIKLLETALSNDKACVKLSSKDSWQAKDCLEEIPQIESALSRLKSEKTTLDKLFVIVEKTSYGASIYNGQVYFSEESAKAEKPDSKYPKVYSVETLGYTLALYRI